LPVAIDRGTQFQVLTDGSAELLIHVGDLSQNCAEIFPRQRQQDARGDGANRDVGRLFGDEIGPVLIDATSLTLFSGDSLFLYRSGDQLVLSSTPTPEPGLILLIATVTCGFIYIVRRKIILL